MLLELRFADKNFDAELNKLLAHRLDAGDPGAGASDDDSVDSIVRTIIAAVRARGDDAVMHYTRKLDHLEATQASQLELSSAAINAHIANVDDQITAALRAAAIRIRAFHQKEVQQSWRYTESNGTRLGQNITALDKIGVYVPGGKAAYPSSVLMTAIPAKVAGVGEIIMTVPTPNAEVDSAVIAAASIAGVDRIFTIGGAQAIAALAYGTETIPRVDKIVGPGNIYVATAKKMVFGDVGIDMIAGPSEVLIICDEAADPDWVAMDLFAQAEHDELAQSIAITTSQSMVEKIQTSVARLLPEMERRKIIEKSLNAQGALILVDSLNQAAEISNRIAPEHLQLMVKDAPALLGQVRHAGAIFVGKYSAEALGDYCAGPSHVLPTAGTARFSSPLGVYDFQKRSSIIQASAAGAHEMAKIAAVLANCEGLTAHRRAAQYRLTPKPDA
ncbi:histidinol dehydrogenase [Candidatus Spongiihabitans sp.]|uniref:histidinol dehydrogenase n=1 Tax=Candidatus Spongiihabitans sp. TaxID=3101308 RepID=UPI003C7C522C